MISQVHFFFTHCALDSDLYNGKQYYFKICHILSWMHTQKALTFLRISHDLLRVMGIHPNKVILTQTCYNTCVILTWCAIIIFISYKHILITISAWSCIQIRPLKTIERLVSVLEQKFLRKKLQLPLKWAHFYCKRRKSRCKSKQSDWFLLRCLGLYFAIATVSM